MKKCFLFLLSVLAALLAGAADQKTLQDCLAEWNKGQGWKEARTNVFGYESRENPSACYDIFVVFDRDRWNKMAPYHVQEKQWTTQITRLRENILVNGFSVVRLYNSSSDTESKFHKGESENWTYYCHDFRVLVRGRRNTVSGQDGSDPIGILTDYLTFAQEYFDALPQPVEGAEANWHLSEDLKKGLRATVRYMRKRARELRREEKPSMADLLDLYAKRVEMAEISHADKPWIGSGEASTSSWTGITLYNEMTNTYTPFTGFSDTGGLAQVASILMHEVAHVYGANEWYAHLIQRTYFDALDVPAEAGMRKFNDEYFDAFPSPGNLRSQYFYTYWVEKHKKTKWIKPASGPYYGNRPKY